MRVVLWGAAVLALASGAQATPVSMRDHAYAIEAMDLGAALRAFARASGTEVIADADLVAGKRSTAVRGTFAPAEALRRMLASSGLTVQLVEGSFVVKPAAVQLQPDQAPDPEVVVVGTRIRGAAPVGAPVTTIDRQAIEQSGRGTVQSLLETIPSNFGGGQNEAVSGNTARNNAGANATLGSSINLRGLGSNSTLVLFDNVRPANGGTDGSFADVSLIPLLAIDRIEILTDGASAIYGSDAVAGVVNFRFRNRFEGAESDVRVATSGGDSQDYELGQIVGRRWNSGGVVVAYQHSDRTVLAGASRRFSTEDLRPYGGPDYRSPFAAPGTITAADGETFAIPAGQDGRHLTAAELQPGVTNLIDSRKLIDLLPRQRSDALYASADQALWPGWGVFAHLLYARRTSSLLRTSSFPYSAVEVPVTNPFYVDPIGTNEPVSVDYGFAADLGPETDAASTRGLSSIVGLTGKLGPWAIEFDGSYGLQIEHERVTNLANSARLDDALADPDPATAYDVFGDGGDTAPATIARVRGSFSQRTRYVVWIGAARADGPLFAVPAGSVRVATGFEHRDERLTFRGVDDSYAETPMDLQFPGLPAERRVNALYAELLVPVFNRRAGLPGRLDLSLAARQEWYSDVGASFNPKAALAWKPVHGLTLRGSYGKSFRAPTFTDNRGDKGNLIEAFPLPDPQSPSGQTVVIGEFGFAPHVGPERARTWTAGADLTDFPVKGVHLSTTAFNIAYRDRIGSASADYYTFLSRRDVFGALVTDHPSAAQVAALFADPRFFNPSGYAQADVGALVNGLIQNLSRSTVRGIDFDVGYRHAVGPGTASVGLEGTRFFTITERLTASSPTANVVSTLGNPVRLRLRGSVGWEEGGLALNAFVNRVGSYSNATVIPAEEVHSWTTVDASVGYAFPKSGPLRGARLSLSALNLLDRDPPYVAYHNFDQTLAFDPEQASPLGRTIALEVSLQL